MKDDGFGELDTDLAGLGDTLGDARQVAAGLDDTMRSLRASMSDAARDLEKLERGFASGLRQAFDAVLLDGAKLSDTLRGLAVNMAETAYSAAVTPVTDHLGGLLAQGAGQVVGALAPFADGGSFVQGRIAPFAKGGVVSGPTQFPMRGGMTGLMGEAGPEAIMPLTRGADGRLGVRAQGAGAPVHVTMNISTPDAGGFQRSRGQIAAQLGRALSRGQRNR